MEEEEGGNQCDLYTCRKTYYYSVKIPGSSYQHRGQKYI
jgi:hypothetical protein